MECYYTFGIINMEAEKLNLVKICLVSLRMLQWHIKTIRIFTTCCFEESYSHKANYKLVNGWTFYLKSSGLSYLNGYINLIAYIYRSILFETLHKSLTEKMS